MPSDPLVLGFDTSAAHCAAALLRGGRVLAARQETMGRGQAERLLPLLEELLVEGNAKWERLDAIGVGTGPGNFTGIRIAVAAARGMALGLGCPAIGVTRFEALTFGSTNAAALPVVPAPRDQLYVGPCNEGPSRLVSVDDLASATKGRPVICATDIPALAAPLLRPVFPVAVATARVAAGRLGAEQPRPAPLYLRSADAAPARDPAPTILP